MMFFSERFQTSGPEIPDLDQWQKGAAAVHQPHPHPAILRRGDDSDLCSGRQLVQFLELIPGSAPDIFGVRHIWGQSGSFVILVLTIKIVYKKHNV